MEHQPAPSKRKFHLKAPGALKDGQNIGSFLESIPPHNILIGPFLFLSFFLYRQNKTFGPKNKAGEHGYIDHNG